MDHNKLQKVLKQKGIPDHFTCLFRNLYAEQNNQLESDKTNQLEPDKTISQNQVRWSGGLDHLTCLFRNLYAGQNNSQNQTRNNQFEQTSSKLEKEYIKAVCCHSAYLTSMQSTSCKMPGWMNTSWNQDCWEKYQSPQICR